MVNCWMWNSEKYKPMTSFGKCNKKLEKEYTPPWFLKKWKAFSIYKLPKQKKQEKSKRNKSCRS